MKRTVKFQAKDLNVITIRAPFFWYNLSLDPNFAFLLRDDDNINNNNNNDCSSPIIDENKVKKWYQQWQMYLAIPIGIFLILLGIVLFKHHWIVFWWKSKFAKQTVQIEMDD